MLLHAFSGPDLIPGTVEWIPNCLSMADGISRDHAARNRLIENACRLELLKKWQITIIKLILILIYKKILTNDLNALIICTATALPWEAKWP